MNAVNTVQIIGQIEEVLQDLGISKELFQPDTFIYRDLQLDSTEIVEISLALKRRLGIKFKLESSHDKTLAEIADEIASLMSESINNSNKT